MHELRRHDEITLAPEYEGRSEGFTRAALVANALHMGVGLCSLDRGHVDLHVHSHEEGFYVLEGEPVLVLDGRAYELEPGACGVVQVGVPHAWRSDAASPARWVDVHAPRPRGPGEPADTFFLGPPPALAPAPLDVRDPRCRNLFQLADWQLDLESLKVGAPVDQPTVSASMATALLAYSGIAVKMLVDERLGAYLHTMFVVEYQPGGVAHPHDHPFEEAYVMLEGTVEAVADGVRYQLEPGDAFWSGVGCVHAFYNTSGSTVRWLEASAPQPPAAHSYRFNRDWDYLAERLEAAPEEVEASEAARA